MDCIFIRELRLPAWIGVYKHEKLAQQTVELDIEIALPGEAVFASGRIQDTIDYGAVVTRLKALLSDERFGLVEKLADRVAGLVMEEFNSPHVRISVTKCGVLKEAKRVGVKLERKR
jgi:dihydroneopterin aldolase